MALHLTNQVKRKQALPENNLPEISLTAFMTQPPKGQDLIWDNALFCNEMQKR